MKEVWIQSMPESVFPATYRFQLKLLFSVLIYVVRDRPATGETHQNYELACMAGTRETNVNFLMMIGIRWWLLIAFGAIVFSEVCAQPLKENLGKDSLWVSPPGLTVGNSFTNKVTYWGWDFGIRQYGLSPYVVLYPGYGLYLYALNYHWSAVSRTLAETDVGIGYEMQYKNLYLTAAYERWIVHYGDDYNRYLLRNYLTGDISSDFNWFNLELIHHYMWGMTDVFVADFLINREYTFFNFRKEGSVFFAPQMKVSIGNRSFRPLFSRYQSEGTPLQLIDYEAGAVIIITFRNIELDMATYYNIPVRPGFDIERPFFYFTLDLNYSFRIGDNTGLTQK